MEGWGREAIRSKMAKCSKKSTSTSISNAPIVIFATCGWRGKVVFYLVNEVVATKWVFSRYQVVYLSSCTGDFVLCCFEGCDSRCWDSIV